MHPSLIRRNGRGVPNAKISSNQFASDSDKCLDLVQAIIFSKMNQNRKIKNGPAR